MNAAYLNNKGKGRGRIASPELRAWREEAGWQLKAQHPPKFVNRVTVTIELDERRQGDADGRIKCVLDILVEHQVIVDDRKKYVKGVYIGWAPVDECVVTIEECL